MYSANIPGGGRIGNTCDVAAHPAFDYLDDDYDTPFAVYYCENAYNNFSAYCDCSSYDFESNTGSVECSFPYTVEGTDVSGLLNLSYATDASSVRLDICYDLVGLETCYSFYTPASTGEESFSCTVDGVVCSACSAETCSFDCTNTEVGTSGEGYISIDGACLDAYIHPARINASTMFSFYFPAEYCYNEFNAYSPYCDCTAYYAEIVPGSIECSIPYTVEGTDVSGLLNLSYAKDEYSLSLDICYDLVGLETCYRYDIPTGADEENLSFSCTVNDVLCTACSAETCSFDCTNTEVGTTGEGNLSIDGVCYGALIHPVRINASTMPPIETDTPTAAPVPDTPEPSTLVVTDGPTAATDPPTNFPTMGMKEPTTFPTVSMDSTPEPTTLAQAPNAAPTEEPGSRSPPPTDAAVSLWGGGKTVSVAAAVVLAYHLMMGI